MDDTELLDLIATAIVDGTDMDCTARDQAASVLRALREEGVLRAEWEAGRDAAEIAALYIDSEGIFGVDSDSVCKTRAHIAAAIRALVYPEAPQ